MSKKCSRLGNNKIIIVIVNEWCQKCCSSNFCVNVPLLKEEAMEIEGQFHKRELDGFVASDGCLGKWKATYTIKERRIVGGGDVLEVSPSTVKRCFEECRLRKCDGD